MDFYDVIKTRRSVRSFSKKQIPDEILKKVLNAARLAPSANNGQPWRYIMVRDTNKIQQIAKLAADQLFISEAPVVIVLCGRRYVNAHSWIGDCMYLLEVGISMDHLVLASRNEGLGTCWVGAFNKHRIMELLRIHDEYPPVMITPLGYPQDDSVFQETSDRYQLEEICFSEVYGNQIHFQ